MLTLDKRIQQCVENACAEIKKGAAVILDCKTGEILASASFPAVDPNDLAACMENEDALVCKPCPVRVYARFGLLAHLRRLGAPNAASITKGRCIPAPEALLLTASRSLATAAKHMGK